MLKYIVAFLLLSFPVYAQYNPGVVVQGTVTAGNAAAFVNNWTIKDSGVPIGTSGSYVTNGIVYYDGTKLTSGSALTWDGTTLNTNTHAINAGNAVVSGATFSANGARMVRGSGSTTIYDNADGLILFTNNANTALSRMSFGAETSSNVALIPSGTNLQIGLGDGTAPGSLSVGTSTAAPASGLRVGGQALFGNNTFPSIAWLDSTNTGIGENSLGRIGFYTSGNLLAQFNATTFVLASGTGFDATAGSFAIHSTNDAAPNGRLDLQSNGGTIRGSIAANATDLLLTAALGGGASANEGVEIIARGTGNVGIGTSGLVTRNSSALDVQGSINSTGSIFVGATISNGTKFTMTGCSNSATTGGTTSGTFTSGVTGACTPVITLPTSPTGWHCHYTDRTTAADANNITETSSTTTSNTATGVTVTGDVIAFSCQSY